MPRPKGSKFVVCDCGNRVLQLPTREAKCKNCGKLYPQLPAPEEAAAPQEVDPLAVSTPQ